MGGDRERDITLGRHEAELQALRDEQRRAHEARQEIVRRLEKALDDYRDIAIEYASETAKNRWARWGALIAISFTFGLIAWLIRYEPDLVERVVRWAIDHWSQSKT